MLEAFGPVNGTERTQNTEDTENFHHRNSTGAVKKWIRKSIKLCSYIILIGMFPRKKNSEFKQVVLKNYLFYFFFSKFEWEGRIFKFRLIIYAVLKWSDLQLKKKILTLGTEMFGVGAFWVSSQKAPSPSVPSVLTWKQSGRFFSNFRGLFRIKKSDNAILQYDW